MRYTYFHLLGLVAILAKADATVSQVVTEGGYYFQWSYEGPIHGFNCIRIEESAEKPGSGWGDNHFCWKDKSSKPVDPGFKWSSKGPIPGMKCTQILEVADPDSWHDNYLCLPCDSSLHLTWSSNHAINRKENCVQWLEPRDPKGTWYDNWLCIEKEDPERAVWPNDFKWSSAGIPNGYKCVQVEEPSEPYHTTWYDNYFCSRCGVKDPGFKWSHHGELRDMKCLQILEKADPHTWKDNYLCYPRNSKLNLKWSSKGPVKGKSCIQWLEPSDNEGTWLDNYLCN